MLTWFVLLQYLLYYSGLELNPQPLWGVSVCAQKPLEETKPFNGRERNWELLIPCAQVNAGLEYTERLKVQRSQWVCPPEPWMPGSVGLSIPDFSSKSREQGRTKRASRPCLVSLSPESGRCKESSSWWVLTRGDCVVASVINQG